MLLALNPDSERRDVHGPLTDANVTLEDGDTSVVDGLGQTQLEDKSLEPSLQEILDLEGQDVIEIGLFRKKEKERRGVRERN